MQDTIASVIKPADREGKYLDEAEIEKIKDYFASGELRIKTATIISANSAAIIKQVAAKSLPYSNAIAPGGNNTYDNRRYAACLRDLDCFLRLASYAILAGHPSILDERVLNGLKETYNSLGVSIETTVKAIETMKEVTVQLVGSQAAREISIYFDRISSSLNGGYHKSA